MYPTDTSTHPVDQYTPPLHRICWSCFRISRPLSWTGVPKTEQAGPRTYFQDLPSSNFPSLTHPGGETTAECTLHASNPTGPPPVLRATIHPSRDLTASPEPVQHPEYDQPPRRCFPQPHRFLHPVTRKISQLHPATPQNFRTTRLRTSLKCI